VGNSTKEREEVKLRPSLDLAGAKEDPSAHEWPNIKRVDPLAGRK